MCRYSPAQIPDHSLARAERSTAPYVFVLDNTAGSYNTIQPYLNLLLDWFYHRTPVNKHLISPAKTFVANRVSEIQTKNSICDWRQVLINDNSADPISWGQTPEEFLHPTIW